MTHGSTAVQNDHGFTADQKQIFEAAEAFARRELYPLAQQMDENEWWPPGLFARIGDAGFLGVTVGQESGGHGLDYVSAGAIIQAFARWNHAVALSYAVHDNIVLDNLYRNSNANQRSQYMVDMIAGRKIGALGLTESGSGSDALGSMRTTACRDGDYYVLNGSKMFITNGPIADVLLVYAKTAPDLGHKGISAFLIERNYAGFHVAQKLDKMGYRGSQTGELVFNDCRVPAGNLIGDENNGAKIIMSGLDIERAMIAPICLGVAERAYQMAIEYSCARKQFGQPIGSFQMVQSMIADMYVHIETMRSFTYRTLSECQHRKDDTDRSILHMMTAASALHASEACNKVLDNALQIHGGIGYIWETEINRLYRSIKLLEIGGGTNQVRRMIIAGEALSDIRSVNYKTDARE